MDRVPDQKHRFFAVLKPGSCDMTENDITIRFEDKNTGTCWGAVDIFRVYSTYTEKNQGSGCIKSDQQFQFTPEGRMNAAIMAKLSQEFSDEMKYGRDHCLDRVIWEVQVTLNLKGIGLLQSQFAEEASSYDQKAAVNCLLVKYIVPS